MRIVTDSSALYSPEEGQQLGITVVPACTVIQNTVYRDYTDISGEEFLSPIAQGAAPPSSQPSIGNVLDVYQEENDEALVLPLGDGLSGTYQNMLGARGMLEHPEKVHVINAKPWPGPFGIWCRRHKKCAAKGSAWRKSKLPCANTSKHPPPLSSPRILIFLGEADGSPL